MHYFMDKQKQPSKTRKKRQMMKSAKGKSVRKTKDAKKTNSKANSKKSFIKNQQQFAVLALNTTRRTFLLPF